MQSKTVSLRIPALRHHHSFRKPLFLSLSLLSLLFATPVRAAEVLRAGDSVAICGDSITEQKLYSVMLETYFLACQPTTGLSAHQFGWSGESVGGLVRRIDQEVLPFQPTVATTCYSMNDGGYLAIDPKRQADFRSGTTESIRKLKAGGVRFIVVGTDGPVDSDTFDKAARKTYPAADYNSKTLADLAEIARQVAAEQGVVYADVRTPFLSVMAQAKAKYGPGYHVAGPDGIHPAANGHLVMAYAFLKALGCNGDVGTLNIDLAANRATATPGHRVLSYAAGKLEVESTKYPFCTYGDPADPNSARGTLEFLPFNQELNRFNLIVTGATAPRLKVTWGTNSKVFAAADLAKGINLAAEFPDNPFSEPFKNVQNAVTEQQKFETPAVKTILHALPNWNTILPEEKAAFDHITKTTIAKANTLSAASRAAIAPVQHTLQVESVIDPVP